MSLEFYYTPLGAITCSWCGKTRRKKIRFDRCYFCGEKCLKHYKLYKERIEYAERKLKDIKNCFNCGKPVKGEGLCMMDKHFIPYRFCSDECCEEWDKKRYFHWKEVFERIEKCIWENSNKGELSAEERDRLIEQNELERKKICLLAPMRSSKMQTEE